MTHIEYIADQTSLPVQVVDGGLLQFIAIDDLIVISDGNKLGIKYLDEIIFVDPTDRNLARISGYIRTGIDEIDEQLNDPAPRARGYLTATDLINELNEGLSYDKY